MGKIEPSDFYLYRWRYYIGYGLITALLAVFLVFVGQNVPGALSQEEINSVVHGASIDKTNFESFAIANAPYYGLQRISISLLGMTILGIKLPSLIIAFIASVGAVLLLRRWFQPNIAMLATLLMLTTGQFLYIAQSATPAIMLIMWSVWLLLAATNCTAKTTKRPRLWKIAFFLMAGLSLYTPLSLYLLLAIISAALWHPHVRFVLKNMNRRPLALYLMIMIIPLIPLGYLISLRPEFLLELLGKPAEWPPDILANGILLLRSYFDFITLPSGNFLTPVFGAGSLALIGLGVWQLIKTHYNARSYTIATWVLLLVPVVLINPIHTAVTFVPFLLVMASGLDYLLRSWYKLFPYNPYARVVGLVPLVILVSGLVLSSIDRYVYGYHYSPAIVKNFTLDTVLLQNQLRKTKEPVSLVVSQGEVPLYNLVAKHAGTKNKTTIIVSSDPSQNLDKTATVIVSKAAKPGYADQQPTNIITNSRSQDADRFYIYKNTSK